MTKIYLIRHAEAEGNHYRRVQGQYDGGITPRGRLQIEALAGRFRDIRIDALYSSDLRRTIATSGAVLAHHDLKLVTDPRLREVHMGAWEDIPWGNAFHDAPEQMAFFAKDPAKWSIPGSENYLQLQERIAGTVSEIASRHEGETVAIVSHGMAIRALVCRILRVPSERIGEVAHGDNTCVALLEYENGELTLEYYNDNSHLSKETSTFANQSWWRNDKGKVDTANMRLVPMNLAVDGQLYKDCYADSWQNAHGGLKGFCGKTYLKNATGVSKLDPRCVMKGFTGGNDFAGIVELDPKRAASVGAGWISFFYLLPEYRGCGFAPQLLGHAVSFFRGQGRDKLRLHVAVSNPRAIRFYEREGFRKIGRDKGICDDLYLMEMSF